jgi:hypothetical protein
MSLQHHVLLALRRAIDATDPIDSVVALWDAINFYVVPISVPKLYERSELDDIKSVVKEHFSESLGGDKVDTALNAICNLNSPPLMVRLKYGVQKDGVQIDDLE